MSAGAQYFGGMGFSGARYDRAAPTGSQTGRRGRIFFCVGMGGMGEGACEKDGQGRPWEWVREGKMGKYEGKSDDDMTEFQ